VSYEPLHHKYRPQTFGQLVGQDAIATTLTHAIRQRRIVPAYLFTGPRGTGKTSSARILAKSLNCLSATVPTDQPCGNCEVCRGIINGSTLDVIEIDAASNTGVDNIRELIERAQFAPVQCRYKVYVIDECHMLSVAAFNALLKTLEEPPERVVFVLATTDPQRVLPTIISRCQRFDFRRIPLAAMVNHLQMIAETEQITITPDALQMVAQIAQGGLRDAESLLDQLSLLSGEITVEQIWDFVGAVPEQDLLTLLEAIANQDSTAILDQTRTLLNRGREPLIVLQNLAEFYRDLLIAKTAQQRHDLVKLTQPTWQQLCQLAQKWEIHWILAGQQHLQNSEVQVKNTTQPRLWLEVTLLGLLPTPSTTSATSAIPPVAPAPVPQFTPAPAPQPTPQPTPQPQPQPPVAPVSSQTSKKTEQASPQPAAPLTADLGNTWQQVVAFVKPNGTQALFRQHGRLTAFDANSACVGIRSQPLLKIAQDKVSNLEAAFEQVFSRTIKVRLEVGNQPKQTTSAPPSDVTAPPQTPPPSDSNSSQNPQPDIDVAAVDTSPPISPPPEPEPVTPVEEVVPVTPVEEVVPEPSSASPPPPVSPTPLPPDLPQPNNNDNDKEAVTQAAQKLATIFQGQVVDLPTTPPTTPPQTTKTVIKPVIEPPPDEDIPF
jgi:DNA polymerase-3 subunit gamma/tau